MSGDGHFTDYQCPTAVLYKFQRLNYQCLMMSDENIIIISPLRSFPREHGELGTSSERYSGNILSADRTDVGLCRVRYNMDKKFATKQHHSTSSSSPGISENYKHSNLLRVFTWIPQSHIRKWLS